MIVEQNLAENIFLIRRLELQIMKEVKTFQQMFRDGHISRRDFLSAMGALGITATTAGGLLTSASALAKLPNRGGSARIFANVLHGPDDTLDPMLGTSTIDYTRLNCGYNGLIQVWDDMSLHPELAGGDWCSRNGRQTAMPLNTL